MLQQHVFLYVWQLPTLQKAKKKSNKKKILLLSDDLRLKSGVGTMSREIIRATIHKYDWVQIGGALDHPDKDKGLIDVSLDMAKQSGVRDAYCKVLPVAGYGDPNILRHLIKEEEPDIYEECSKIRMSSRLILPKS